MRRLHNILTLVLTLLLSMAHTMDVYADAVGTWRIYPSYSDVELVEMADKTVFVLASKNLYSYSPDEEVIQTYDKTNCLSDVGITMISWNAAARCMVVTYENSNIDLITVKGDVVNVPDLYLKQMTGDKSIYGICHDGKFAYLSTGFGVVKVDVDRGYIADSYVLNKQVSSVAVLDGNIYALCAGEERGVLKASQKENLNNPASWQMLTPVYFQYMFSLGGNLIGMTDGNANTIDPATGNVTQVGLFNFSWAKKCGDRIICGKNATVVEMLPDLTYNTYTCPNEVKNIGYSSRNKKYWMNDANNRLARFGVSDAKLIAETTGVMPEGPVTNESYMLDFADGKLYAVNGYHTVDKSSNFSGMIYSWNGDSWDYYSEDIASVTKRRYRNVSCIKVAPYDKNVVMAGGETGLYRFVNGKFDCVYDSGNSPLASEVPTSSEPRNWTIVTSLAYDSEGTLWAANSSSTAISCLTKEGEWKKFDHRDLLGGYYNVCPMGALVDERGYLWFCSTHWEESRVFRYDIKNDNLKRYNDFVNQDGARYVPYLRNMAEDKHGNIWIAGSKGPFYIKSEDIASGNDVMTQHKVPRNDGTNFADYLLADIDIMCIAVDDANRKWMGTNGYGVFVISDDCNTQEFNFTTENSPLVSNNVSDIKIDKKTGVVYFATSKGICSYVSGVSESKDDVDKDKVWAYPNPVTPDYTGYITVTGLTNASQVIITTVSGQKVAEGVSVGGSFVWDGRDSNGNSLASGVYMVLVAGPDGKNNVVTKIAMIK